MDRTRLRGGTRRPHGPSPEPPGELDGGRAHTTPDRVDQQGLTGLESGLKKDRVEGRHEVKRPGHAHRRNITNLERRGRDSGFRGELSRTGDGFLTDVVPHEATGRESVGERDCHGAGAAPEIEPSSPFGKGFHRFGKISQPVVAESLLVDPSVHRVDGLVHLWVEIVERNPAPLAERLGDLGG